MAVRHAFTFSSSKLRARRKELGYSRDFVAFMSGVTTCTIANWEQGYCKPRNPEKLATLAEVLECSSADLFEEVAFDG